MVIIGIDPGKTGAVAVIMETSVSFIDTPLRRVGKREVYELCTMNRYLEVAKREADEVHAFLEKLHPLPSKMRGGQSDFWSGYGFGVWEALLVANRIPYTLVAPLMWKKEMMAGMGKEKEASIVRALQLRPELAEKLQRKRDHNRADALLIAEWGRKQLGTGNQNRMV